MGQESKLPGHLPVAAADSASLLPLGATGGRPSCQASFLRYLQTPEGVALLRERGQMTQWPQVKKRAARGLRTAPPPSPRGQEGLGRSQREGGGSLQRKKRAGWARGTSPGWKAKGSCCACLGVGVGGRRSGGPFSQASGLVLGISQAAAACFPLLSPPSNSCALATSSSWASLLGGGCPLPLPCFIFFARGPGGHLACWLGASAPPHAAPPAGSSPPPPPSRVAQGLLPQQLHGEQARFPHVTCSWREECGPAGVLPPVPNP